MRCVMAGRRAPCARMKIWTVGHSTHSLEAFVELLSEHGIALVADIRTVPKSRRHPHFDTDALTQSLPDRGITYVHLPRLGGWRRAAADSPNGGWRNASFRGYADYATSDEFATGLAQLRELAAADPVAMMCSEALWWRCHRRLVADRPPRRRGRHGLPHRLRRARFRAPGDVFRSGWSRRPDHLSHGVLTSAVWGRWINFDSHSSRSTTPVSDSESSNRWK
jgi:hypothetical protein